MSDNSDRRWRDDRSPSQCGCDRNRDNREERREDRRDNRRKRRCCNHNWFWF